MAAPVDSGTLATALATTPVASGSVPSRGPRSVWPSAQSGTADAPPERTSTSYSSHIGTQGWAHAVTPTGLGSTPASSEWSRRAWETIAAVGSTSPCRQTVSTTGPEVASTPALVE